MTPPLRRILQWARRLATANRAPVLAVHAHPPAQRVHSRAVRERVLDRLPGDILPIHPRSAPSSRRKSR